MGVLRKKRVWCEGTQGQEQARQGQLAWRHASTSSTFIDPIKSNTEQKRNYASQFCYFFSFVQGASMNMLLKSN